MVKQQEKKTLVKSEKLTQGEKKKLKNENKAKANPEKAAAKKEKNDATRARRYIRLSKGMRSLRRITLCRVNSTPSVQQHLTRSFLSFASTRITHRAESGSVKKLG